MQTFNPTQFITNYPIFTGLDLTYLTSVFDNQVLTSGRVIWGLFKANSDQEYYWACLVLAHILVLSNGQNGSQNGIGKVGVITSAATGDVHTGFEVPVTNGSWYWQQTSYGAACYNLLMQRGGATLFAAPATYNGYIVNPGYNRTNYNG